MKRETVIVIDFGDSIISLLHAVSESAMYTAKSILIKQISKKSKP